jgi:hypothetical protein
MAHLSQTEKMSQQEEVEMTLCDWLRMEVSDLFSDEICRTNVRQIRQCARGLF